MLRQPAVAGYFYPSDPRELRTQITGLLEKSPPSEKLRAVGCIVPHAGYIYSGKVAAAVYARLELPKRYIILCPRHRPPGAALAINCEGAWRTPLGDASIDSELAGQIVARCAALREDSVAHSREHSLEVQLPFLQQLAGDFRFVPIAIGLQRLEPLEELGQAIAEVVKAHKEPILVVASSDMNHHEPDGVTRRKDRKAIERILALDARGLHETVFQESITMCGVGPAVAMLTAAKQLGATSAQEILYETSSNADPKLHEVVGYAGIIVQ